MNLIIQASESTGHHETFLPTLVIIALAFIVPLLVGRINSRLAVPIVVGEIFLGIVAGLLYPELKTDGLLEILSEIGFGYLFFLAGTEIDFASLKARGGLSRSTAEKILTPIRLSVIWYILTLILSAGLCYILFQFGVLSSNGWLFMAIAMAPSSLGIIVTVLKETQYARTELGQKVLVAATVADFATVLMLTVAVSVLASGLSFDLALIGLIFVAFGILYLIARALYRREAVRNELSRLDTPTTPIKLRFAFFIFMIFMALSVAIGAEIVLGTFMAGMLVKLLMRSEDHDVLHALESIGFSFFVPIFFIMIGVEFDVAALLASWREAVLLLPVLFVLAIVVKIVPAFLLRFMHDAKSAFASGMLLTARLSLLVAVAKEGVDLGMFDPATEAALILLAMFMATVGPLVFIRMMPSPEVAVAPPIIVTNAGRLGLDLAEQLRRHGERVVLIDSDESHVTMALENGFECVLGHVRQPNAEVAAYLEVAQRFVSVYTERDMNFQICKFVKEQYGVPHVVAEVPNPSDVAEFEEIGVLATNTALDRTSLLVMHTRSQGSYELMTRTDDDQEIHEVTLRNHLLVNKSLRQVKLPVGMIVMVLRRHGEMIVPNGDTTLHLNDLVTVVGPLKSGSEIYRMFSSLGRLGATDIIAAGP